MSTEESQKRLQELLSAARGALEEALAHAKEQDLWFEFAGLRRGPGGEFKTLDVNSPEEVEETRKDDEEWGGRMPKTQVDSLVLAEEWVGSWC